ESARAPLACFDDAPPEERVRGVGGAAGVIRRRTLIDVALAATPGEGAGNRLPVLFGKAHLGVTSGDQRSPHATLVIPGACDESGALSGLRVEVVERAEIVVAARLAEGHAALLCLTHAPPGVLLESAEKHVLIRPEIQLERGDHRLNVGRAAKARD